MCVELIVMKLGNLSHLCVDAVFVAVLFWAFCFFFFGLQ